MDPDEGDIQLLAGGRQTLSHRAVELNWHYQAGLQYHVVVVPRTRSSDWPSDLRERQYYNGFQSWHRRTVACVARQLVVGRLTSVGNSETLVAVVDNDILELSLIHI